MAISFLKNQRKLLRGKITSILILIFFYLFISFILLYLNLNMTPKLFSEESGFQLPQESNNSQENKYVNLVRTISQVKLFQNHNNLQLKF